MGLQEDFEKAAEVIKPVKGLTNDEMLDLYGLFKQAKEGDNTTTRPGLLDLKGKSKWDAWTKRKGLTKDEAIAAYIELVKQLLAKYAPDLAATL